MSSSLPPGRLLHPQLRNRQSCHYKYTSDLFHGGGKVPTRPKICIRSTRWLEVAWLPVSVSGVQLCCGKPSSFSTVLLIAKNMMKPEPNGFLCLITVSIINYSPMSEFNHISYSKGAFLSSSGVWISEPLGLVVDFRAFPNSLLAPHWHPPIP